MRKRILAWLLAAFLLTVPAGATIFGTVRGIAHDPHHRPVAGASLTLSAKTSALSKTAWTNDLGEFSFLAVPLGEYRLSIMAPGFRAQEQNVIVSSGSVAEVHFPLAVQAQAQSVEVSAEAAAVNSESSNSQSSISRAQISAAPGAERTNSLAFLTDYIPGAYVIHDQLHIRGGHDVSWLLDGVPVPNTNMASNVGPQFDPKDIDVVEVQRGGYSAEYGDRAYGVFNVVPRSGFEGKNEGALTLSYGNFHNTNDQLSFGSHTDRFAYYASLTGNHTDLGLETPAPQVLHDESHGLGAFTSLIFNATANDQLRMVASGRADQYEIPNHPAAQAAGIRDREKERDAFANFSWVHIAGRGVLLTLSPFYHFNRAAFAAGVSDPEVSEDDRSSNYAGGQATVAVVAGKHNAMVGVYGFAQRDNTLFALRAPGVAGLRLRESLAGDVEALFLEDQYKLTPWLTFNGGLRLTRFSGSLTETAASPRIGAALRLPRLHWVLRGFYGRYYQAPPLSTVSGELLNFAVGQGFGFLPLHGERDEQHEFGLLVPVRGWTLEVDQFHTAARNFFDHDALGNSNIFFPLSIDRVRIRGLESTIRSPRLLRRAQAHLAYSHQSVEGTGGVVGGFTGFRPVEEGFFYLDHDQRNTIAAGLEANLPWRSFFSVQANHGSGFLNGDGPAHLPSHTTFDVALGKSFGESWSARVTALNLSNHRYLQDLANSFGGTHFAYPRQVYGQITYTFHY